jgi:DNA-binding transcriptional LysR family regulator
LREKESALRAAVLRKFHEFGIRPSVIIEASSPDFIAGYVKQNKGVSFMNEHDIKEELEKGILKVIPIDEGNIILFSDIIYHTEKPLSPSAEAFLKMVERLRGQIRREFKALSASLIAPIPH